MNWNIVLFMPPVKERLFLGVTFKTDTYYNFFIRNKKVSKFSHS